MRKVYLESLGCAKNQVDSEILLTYLKEEGFERTDNSEEADLLIVNTCGFIESAKEESLSVFFDLRNRYPDKKIVLSGCLAERYGENMVLDEADAIFGNKDLERIKEVVSQLYGEEKKITLLPKEYGNESGYERDTLLSYPGCAYLKISEGCNHWCSYCAIPIIRGNLRSLDKASILKEAKRLIEKGIYEIDIIAQDLASYGKDRGESDGFIDLIKALSELEGDFVLRMLYIHPDDFPLGLLDAVKSNKKILPYFDIPFQHSHESVLSKMGRKGNREKYVSLIKRIRDEIPEAVIRSTIMVGFPTESKASIADLKLFLSEAELDWMGSFVYSREEGTKAYRMTNSKKQLEMEKKALRWQKEIERIQEPITEKRLERFVGKTYKALVEERIEGEDIVLSRIYSQAPEVDGVTVVRSMRARPGDVIDVRITRVNGVDLEGIEIV